tara:strand:+ start:296 stop:745 length:450 start_codon:yes stop_codon:yes gene_type:complete
MQKLTTLILLMSASVAVQAVDLSVNNAYIRTMPPGQTTTAGFLSVTNNSLNHCRLLSGTSSISPRIEFHEHQHAQGMMQMRKVDSVVVAAGQTVTFSPGALHIMLFEIDKTVNVGDTTQMEIASDQCGAISFTAETRSLIQKPMTGMHH